MSTYTEERSEGGGSKTQFPHPGTLAPKESSCQTTILQGNKKETVLLKARFN